MANQQPWVVQFNGTSKPALVAPFDRCRSHETDMAALQGKRCLGLDGDWALMLDELTRECFLMSFAGTSSWQSPTVISLPPLPEDTMPPSCLPFGCLSNQTPPDCTVMLDFAREKPLLYRRPTNEKWAFGQDPLVSIVIWVGTKGTAASLQIRPTARQLLVPARYDPLVPV
jgi:hypothetical protein